MHIKPLVLLLRNDNVSSFAYFLLSRTVLSKNSPVEEFVFFICTLKQHSELQFLRFIKGDRGLVQLGRVIPFSAIPVLLNEKGCFLKLFKHVYLKTTKMWFIDSNNCYPYLIKQKGCQICFSLQLNYYIFEIIAETKEV